MRTMTLTLSLVLLLASPAYAQDTTPGGSAFSGFPIALVVLAVVATVYALLKRRSNARKYGER